MRKTITAAIVAVCMTIISCGADEAPQQIQSIPDNPANMSISNVEPVEIVPGLSKRTLLQGKGDVVEAGQIAVVHYTGWLFDAEAEKQRGAKFDSSVDRGDPFSFVTGAGQVIQGWDAGVVGMQVGEVRELTIAPEMGYGSRDMSPQIPPNSTLVFVVELVEIN